MEVDFSKQIKELKRGSGDSLIYSSGKDISDDEISTILNDILESKAELHNSKHEKQVSVDQLKKVYFRGSKSYETTHRAGKTRGQWAVARVNMFLKMNRGEDVCDSYLISDKDILISESDSIADNDIYPFFDFSDIDLNLASLDLVKAGIEKWDQDFHCEEILYSEAEKKTLNKPFIFKDGGFGVFVKNPKNLKTSLVRFEAGEDKAEGSLADINEPEHWCAKFWNKKPIDESISPDAVEWDEEEIVTEWVFDSSSFASLQDLLEINEDLKNLIE